ncbi:MAG: RNA polymerase sigma factor [Chloroflexota bacterium]
MSGSELAAADQSEGTMTVEALRRRRPQTLADLLDAHGREIQAVAYLILRDSAAAEDVTIETLLTAFEKGGSIRDEASVRPWLLKVATNQALTARRRGIRLVALEDQHDRAAPGDLGGDAATSLTLLAGVADLPPAMRAAVVLRYYSDLTVEQVAAALGKSPNTIKAQLQTALDRLRVSFVDPAAPSATEARHA